MRPTFPVSSVEEVDLLEQPLTADALEVIDEQGTARLALRPFQIVTLRLGRA